MPHARPDPYEHPAYRYSHIARPIDRTYPTNVWIVIVSIPFGLAYGAVAYFQRGETLPSSLVEVAFGAVAAFLVWALARELAPDEPYTAFVAVAFALPPLLIWSYPPLLETGVVLLAVRVANRTVGPPAKSTDLMVVLVLTGAVTLLLRGWPTGIAVGIALMANGLLAKPQRESLLLGPFALVAGIIALTIDPSRPAAGLPEQPWLAACGAIAVSYLVTVALQRPLATRADLEDEPPARARVCVGMLVPWIAAVVYAVARPGEIDVHAIWWTTLAAISVGRVATVVGLLPRDA